MSSLELVNVAKLYNSSGESYTSLKITSNLYISLYKIFLKFGAAVTHIIRKHCTVELDSYKQFGSKELT